MGKTQKWDVYVTKFDENNVAAPEECWGEVDDAHVAEIKAIAEVEETPRHYKDSTGNVDRTFYILHSDGNGCLERYTPKFVKEEDD